MNPKKGDVVLVEFLDHTEDGDEPMLCFVAGRLRSKGKVSRLGGTPRRYMVIEAWWVGGDASQETKDANARVFTILTSTIVRVLSLRIERTEQKQRRCKDQSGKPDEDSPGNSEESHT